MTPATPTPGLRRRTLLGGLAAASLTTAACGQRRPEAGTTKGGSTSVTRIAYGDDPSQFGELSGLATGTRGVVVVIHGGFWKAAYDLSLGRPLAASLVEHGWTAWNLEYRRVGDGGGVPATLDDVAAGIDRLAGVDGLSLDGPVVAVGHSAGGHLGVWAGSRARFAPWRPQRVALTGVVSQAGVLDLSAAYDDDLGAGAVEAFLGHPPGPADAPVDPIRQVPLDVPVWCVHGRDDDTVPLAQSTSYVAAATRAGARAELVEVGGGHMDLIDVESAGWAAVLRLLDGPA